MSQPVRLAGWGTIGDAIVTWTIAEGRRGRRWREVVTRADAIVHSLLLETDRDGGFSHLELSVPGALLTLHPEPDGTLHGNRVGADGTGVAHVVGLPFGAGAVVVVEGSPIGAAATAWALTRVVAVPGLVTVPGVTVDRFGRVDEAAALIVERSSTNGWRIGGGEAFELGADGMPRLPGGTVTALET